MSRFRLDKTTVLALVAVTVLLTAYAATVWLSNRYYVVSAPASSVYSASPDGFKVLYTYLAELGRSPKPLQSFEDMPRKATIVAAGPFQQAPTPGEAEVLVKWVRGGGRLVAVGGEAHLLLDQMGFGGSPNSADASSTAPPLFPGAYAIGIREVRPGSDRLLLDAPAWVTHYKDLGGQILVSQQVGKGEVVWLAGPYPLSNAGIGRADNGKLALALTTSGGRDVYFDEYHHGFARQSGYWDRMGAGARSAILLLAGALAIALVGWARRVGPPIPAESEPEARRGAYIGQLAQLYRKAGARADALASLEDGLVRALARTHGTLEAGLGRHPEAKRALEESRALRESGAVAEDGFVQTARRLSRMRQEVTCSIR